MTYHFAARNVNGHEASVFTIETRCSSKRISEPGSSAIRMHRQNAARGAAKRTVATTGYANGLAEIRVPPGP